MLLGPKKIKSYHLQQHGWTEDIMLIAISQSKTNTIRFHLSVESKECKEISKTETDSEKEETDGCQR